MKWEKQGLICNNETIDLEWYKLNVMTPVPYLKDKETLRLFITMCDSQNRGRIGYIDVDPENPGRLLRYSKKPVLDIGKKGRFDEDGVVGAQIFEEEDKLWFTYSGYQKHRSYPYASLTGIAYSTDGGESFQRGTEVPLLERQDDELFIRSSGEIYEMDGRYRIFYSAGDDWVERKGSTIAPKYEIKYLESDDKNLWIGCGKTAVQLREDEYGITCPQIIKTNNGWEMFYSVRSLSKGYRIGYAVSEDGRHFARRDELIGLDVSEDGFDSEMICFGRVFAYKDKTYMFYCGNHYGRGGLGYAVLIEK